VVFGYRICRVPAALHLKARKLLGVLFNPVDGFELPGGGLVP
jgi:hypothetical protein